MTLERFFLSYRVQILKKLFASQHGRLQAGLTQRPYLCSAVENHKRSKPLRVVMEMGHKPAVGSEHPPRRPKLVFQNDSWPPSHFIDVSNVLDRPLPFDPVCLCHRFEVGYRYVLGDMPCLAVVCQAPAKGR